MPEETFYRPISYGNTIRIRMRKVGRRITAFTAQYETWHTNQWYPVVRFDSAHGRAHMDVLNHRGDEVAKVWLDFTEPYNEALQYAIEDIDRNYEFYRGRFLDELNRSIQ